MRRVRPLALSSLSLVLICSADSFSSVSSATSKSDVVRFRVLLTNSTVGPGTQIDDIDMVSSTNGYGVAANNPFHPTGVLILIRTANGAESWTVRGPLPSSSFHVSGASRFRHLTLSVGELVTFRRLVPRAERYS